MGLPGHCCSCLYLFVDLFSFFLSKWNAARSGWDQSGHWPGHCRIFHFQTFKNSWAAFTLCFRSLPFCTLKCPPVKFAAFARTLHKVTLCSLQKMYLCKRESWPSAKEAMLIHASYCIILPLLYFFKCSTLQDQNLSKPSPHFLLHSYLTGCFFVFGNFIILSFSSLNTFASCGDPSVFLCLHHRFG